MSPSFLNQQKGYRNCKSVRVSFCVLDEDWPSFSFRMLYWSLCCWIWDSCCATVACICSCWEDRAATCSFSSWIWASWVTQSKLWCYLETTANPRLMGNIFRSQVRQTCSLISSLYRVTMLSCCSNVFFTSSSFLSSSVDLWTALVITPVMSSVTSTGTQTITCTWGRRSPWPSRSLTSLVNSWSNSICSGDGKTGCGFRAAREYSSCLVMKPSFSTKFSFPMRFSISCFSFSLKTTGRKSVFSFKHRV